MEVRCKVGMKGAEKRLRWSNNNGGRKTGIMPTNNKVPKKWLAPSPLSQAMGASVLIEY